MNNLKNNNKQARQRGTTLIELSVVIAVLLLLVGVLFIGITAWKNGANKAACLVSVSSIQKAVRGYENMNGLTVANPCPTTVIAGPGLFFATMPKCPSGTVYTTTGTVPADGIAYATCATHPLTAAQTANW
jgi:prepilin-type N-terminal cleavage/methylation domain-containing protein